MRERKKAEICAKFKRKAKYGLYRMYRPFFSWNKGDGVAVSLGEESQQKAKLRAGPFATVLTSDNECLCASPWEGGE